MKRLVILARIELLRMLRMIPPDCILSVNAGASSSIHRTATLSTEQQLKYSDIVVIVVLHQRAARSVNPDQHVEDKLLISGSKVRILHRPPSPSKAYVSYCSRLKSVFVKLCRFSL